MRGNKWIEKAREGKDRILGSVTTDVWPAVKLECQEFTLMAGLQLTRNSNTCYLSLRVDLFRHSAQHLSRGRSPRQARNLNGCYCCKSLYQKSQKGKLSISAKKHSSTKWTLTLFTDGKTSSPFIVRTKLLN